MKVGIIGAGLAGLAAGLELADRGHAVELFERRPWAGGATWSFRDDETGDEIDNGQHVFMHCTTAYRAFLERLGTIHLTRRQERLRVPVFDRDGRRSDLWAANLPLGLHLAPALLRYRHLSWRQKGQIARAVLSLQFMPVHERARLERVSFGEWLRERGQSPETIREYWDFLVIPTLNCRADEASASQALFVLEEGFLKDPRAAALAVPAAGLSELHVSPAVRAIEARGGAVSLRAGVERIEIAGGRVAGLRLADGGARALDACVSALPPWRLPPLLPAEARARSPFDRLGEFRPAPILNLHLWFDRPVAEFPFAAFIHSEAQWAFSHNPPEAEEGAGAGGGQRLTLSISAPGALFGLNQAQLCERLLPQLRRALPASRAANLLRARLIKEPEATFLPAPGLARPGARTPIPNLFLAGAWTDTGWPATMESAVRSGLAAAVAVEAAGA